jgi:hypothetical protein
LIARLFRVTDAFLLFGFVLLLDDIERFGRRLQRHLPRQQIIAAVSVRNFDDLSLFSMPLHILL